MLEKVARNVETLRTSKPSMKWSPENVLNELRRFFPDSSRSLDQMARMTKSTPESVLSKIMDKLNSKTVHVGPGVQRAVRITDTTLNVSLNAATTSFWMLEAKKLGVSPSAFISRVLDEVAQKVTERRKLNDAGTATNSSNGRERGEGAGRYDSEVRASVSGDASEAHPNDDNIPQGDGRSEPSV